MNRIKLEELHEKAELLTFALDGFHERAQECDIELPASIRKLADQVAHELRDELAEGAS